MLRNPFATSKIAKISNFHITLTILMNFHRKYWISILKPSEMFKLMIRKCYSCKGLSYEPLFNFLWQSGVEDIEWRYKPKCVKNSPKIEVLLNISEKWSKLCANLKYLLLWNVEVSNGSLKFFIWFLNDWTVIYITIATCVQKFKSKCTIFVVVKVIRRVK